jgi:hypothetical protein
MKYDDIHPAFRQAIGCREGFRAMGFSADDLYIEPRASQDPGRWMIFMTLKPRRGEPFRVGAGLYPVCSQEEFSRAWRAVCDAYNGGKVSQADMDRIWQESYVYQDKVGFAVALMQHGIRPPRSLS